MSDNCCSYSELELLRGLIEQLSAYINTYHGGEVEFVSFDGKVVKVRMGGACVGCPHSPATIKAAMVRQFQITGRKLPTAEQPNGPVFRMNIFANNTVVAKSRFNYFLSQLKKVKRSHCEILEVKEIFEKKPLVVKNFGLNIRYDSRHGTHNMYKEFRDTTINGAVDQMYMDMSARHRAQRSSIQIVSFKPIDKVVRSNMKQFHQNKIRFPLIHRPIRAPNKDCRSLFVATRPSTLF